MAVYDGMVSKYYTPQGKRLQDISISDRKRALHTTKEAWKNVTGHLDRKIIAQQAKEKEEAHRKAMKEGSDNMTKNWMNSIHNVRLRKEEQRIKRQAQLEEERERNFKEVSTVVQAEREQFLAEMRKLLFREDENAKRLNGALALSRTLKEREKQKVVTDMIKEHDRLEEEKWVQHVIEGAEDEKREKEEERQKDLKKKEVARELFLSQKMAVEGVGDRERQVRIAEEMIDNEKAAKELAAIEQFEKDEAFRKKEMFKEDFRIFKEKQEVLKKKLEAEEEERDLIIKIVGEAKDRIRCLTDKRKRELFEADVKKRIEAGEKVRFIKESHEAEEEEKRLRVIAEREAAEDEEDENRKAKQRQITQDRIQYHHETLARKAKEKAEQDETTRWEMLNRFKHDEILKAQDEAEKKKSQEKMEERRAELVGQINDNEERRKAEHQDIYGAKDYSDVDRQFFEYAEEVMNYAKERELNTMPIEREIEAYKREIGMVKKPSKQQIMSEYKKSYVSLKPGKMCHDPKSDPTYCRCRCYKNSVFH